MPPITAGDIDKGFGDGCFAMNDEPAGRRDGEGRSPRTKGRKALTDGEVAAGRARILAAARTLFAQKGYAAVSIRAVAAMADMSAMSLYRYYPNKRGILVHIWAEIFSDIFAAGRAAAAQHEDPRAALEAYAVAFVRYWIDNPENYVMVYGERDAPVGGEAFFADSGIVAGELAFFGGLIERAGKPPESVDLLLQQFICAMHGVCNSLIMIPEMRWAPAETLIRGMVSALLRD